jgi:LysM repeat protein
MNKANKIVLCIGLLINTFYVFAEKQDSVGITKINGKFHIRYMVSPGETVYRISTKYKISVSDLIDLNPELENGLKTGQILNIPYVAEPVVNKEDKAIVLYPKPSQQNTSSDDSLTENGVIHTIKQGETYATLAQKYNLSVDELLKINKVEPKVGQKIIINDKIKAKSNGSSTQPQVRSEPKQNIIPEKTSEKTIAETPENEPIVAIDYENKKKNLLVIPFDPYLYFSDADDEIASVSKMQRTKVRQAFRRRLNALLEPKGYETIHLLGGKAKDSITDLNKIYSSVNYSYQDLLINPNKRVDNEADKTASKGKKEIVNLGDNSRAAQAQDAKKYFGVRINNPDFFTFFNNKYRIDYYLFINQFEVKTNFENCLDRATMNYERGFTIHYSIFDKNGKQIAGNRIYIDYNSNTNSISKILADNMQRAADKIMGELPPAE